MARHRRSFIPAIIPLATLLLACGLSSTVGPVQQTPTATPTSAPAATATPPPSAKVTRVVKSKYFADSKSGGTSAPCANGDPLINGDCGVTVTATCAGGVVVSGGYLLSDPLAFVTSSYPSSATAWTVTAHDEGQDGGSHPVTVTTYADCLTASPSAAVVPVVVKPSIPNDSNFHEATVACPAAGVVTGGGFRGTNSTPETIPAANGWTVSLSVQLGASAKPSLYALCATAHLAAAGHPKVSKSPALGSGTTASVACPAGTLLVGGGGKTIGFGNLTQLAADGAVTHWNLTVAANGVVGGPPTTYTVTDYAVCVTVS